MSKADRDRLREAYRTGIKALSLVGGAFLTVILMLCYVSYVNGTMPQPVLDPIEEWIADPCVQQARKPSTDCPEANKRYFEATEAKKLEYKRRFNAGNS